MNTENVSNEEKGNGVLADVTPSCLTCLYSKNGKYPCNRHLHRIPPDYSKGHECFYNNYAHYRHFRYKA